MAFTLFLPSPSVWRTRAIFSLTDSDTQRPKRAGEDATEMIKNTEENKKSAAEKEAEGREVFQQLNSKLLLIGNLVRDSVPVDNDKTTPDTQVSQEPLEETAVNESPSKTGENHILPTPRLRRRFVPASNSEDRIHDTTEADSSAPVKLDAGAQAHIEKHRLNLNHKLSFWMLQ